jgi:hypothetical protein
VADSEFGEHLPRGAELSDAAVDQDQAGQGPAFIAQAGITAADDLGH